MQEVGGRKFILAVLFFVALFVLTLVGKITADQFLMSSEIVLSGYFAANAVKAFAIKQ